jgi:formylglycine-generating enzyme required for sulfatase activity
MLFQGIMFLLVLSAIVFSAIPTADTATNALGMKFKRIPAGTFMMGYEGGDRKSTRLNSSHP